MSKGADNVVGLTGAPLVENPLAPKARAMLEKALADGAAVMLLIYQRDDGEVGMEGLPVDVPAVRKGMLIEGFDKEDEDGEG